MLRMNIFLFYVIGFLLNLFFFIFLFNIDIGINTFFYKGLLITFLSLFFQIFILIILVKYKLFLINKLHVVISGSLTLCFTLMLHTLILTSLDRAISVYFISMMNDNNISLSKEEIKKKFFIEYFESDQAIERRIEEQLITGNIEEINNKYIITQRGERIFVMFKYLSKIFNIKNNYVPKYNFN